MLNAAARLVVGAGKVDHLTPVLRDVLHWLLVLQRIQFKVALTAFDCISGFGPTYSREFCIPVADISSLAGQTSVRLNVETWLCHAWTRTQLGRRSFHVAAPVVWNALLVCRRSTSISRGQFRAGALQPSLRYPVRTFLF